MTKKTKKTKTTQIDKLYNRLATGKNLTFADARRLGVNVARLSRMVYDLRQEGCQIDTTKVATKSGPVTAYRMAL